MVFLSYEEMQATEAKVAKIMKRAQGKGFTGKLEVTSEATTRTHTAPSGHKVTEHGYDVTITGAPPKYNGWTFLARIEWADGKPVTFNAPGTDGTTVDRASLQPGACDHCKQDRYRVHTFVVRHDDGRQVQVGSTCIKDFLGWDANTVQFFGDDDATSWLSDMAGSLPPAYDVETVLAFAWAAIKVNGFVRASDYGYSTKAQVLDAIDPRDKRSRETADAIRPYVAESEAQAKRVRDFVLSADFGPTTSDYVVNLKNICEAGSVTAKMFGFLVSAPQAYARHQERTLVRKAETESATNEWLATPGERITVKATLLARRYFRGDYGTTTLYTFRTDTGHTVKWFCNAKAEPFGDAEVEDHATVELTGTVGKHDEYNGRKSTSLKRCAVKR